MDEWIDFQLKKPGDGQRCLIWVDNSFKKGPRTCVGHPWSGEETYCYTYRDNLWAEFSESYQPPVRFWMLLPTPPTNYMTS